MNYDNIFNDNNIGLPLKVRKITPKGETFLYGRYLGHGYDGNSTNGEDYNIISMVTPSSVLVRAETYMIGVLTDKKDLKELLKEEKKVKNPYEKYLLKKNKKYYKTYYYLNDPMTFNDYPLEWFIKNDFFEIDEDLFGNSLAKIFTKELGKEYKFQRLDAVCEIKDGPIQNHKLSTKYISVISPNEYQDEYYHYIGKKTSINKNVSCQYLFQLYPLEVKKEDFLIYFGNYLYTTIELGEIIDNEVQLNLFNPIIKTINKDEIKYDNENYPFVLKFIEEIIKYKLDNRKCKINEKDMDIILEKFGIEKDKALIKKM